MRNTVADFLLLVPLLAVVVANYVRHHRERQKRVSRARDRNGRASGPQ